MNEDGKEEEDDDLNDQFDAKELMREARARRTREMKMTRLVSMVFISISQGRVGFTRTDWDNIHSVSRPYNDKQCIPRQSVNWLGVSIRRIDINWRSICEQYESFRHCSGTKVEINYHLRKLFIKGDNQFEKMLLSHPKTIFIIPIFLLSVFFNLIFVFFQTFDCFCHPVLCHYYKFYSTLFTAQSSK